MRVRGLLVGLALSLVSWNADAKLKHFKQVDEGVFRGSKPKIEEDYEELRSHGIRTIMDLRVMPTQVRRAKKNAKKYGFHYRSIPISPLTPNVSSKKLKKILSTLVDPELRPVFVHCLFGNERTGFVVGLYRTYVQKWTSQETYREMREDRFKPFLVPGLYRFFMRVIATGGLDYPWLEPVREKNEVPGDATEGDEKLEEQ
jgi:protein tyrosine/serine phosphatase